LIKRVPVVKLRITVAAELTRPAGAGVEATGGSAIDMFHVEYLRKGKDDFARVNRIFDCALSEGQMTMSLYYKDRRCSTPLQRLPKNQHLVWFRTFAFAT
jgi:hypothetical protein